MRFSIICFALAAMQVISAHTIFTTLFVNGVNQGDATCVRMSKTPDNATSPVSDLTSPEMACGWDGNTGVARVCSANQSSTLSFQFREWADASHPGVIDPGHKGPCAVYMKKVESAIDDPGNGDGWFKIWDSGYDEVTSEWCTTKLINEGGFLSVDIPEDLAGGYYLVRPELLALHQANASPPDPQFYIGCAQIFLQSTATSITSETVSIPGYVEITDPSVTFNIYTPTFPYPIPGPEPYENSTSSNIEAFSSQSRESVQMEGLKPEGCLLTVGNWCGMELAHYHTETDCWNASEACWDQDTICWESPPTGGQLCNDWESHCYAIQAACNSGDFVGPPNAGISLQPKLPLLKTTMWS